MDIDPVTELQRCLALVRPVGMTDSAVRDWLAAAVAEVRGIAPRALTKACAEVRRTITHHGQIVPAILASQAVKDGAAHEREVRRLLADGHTIPGRNAPQIEHRGATKRIGNLKLIESAGEAR